MANTNLTPMTILADYLINTLKIVPVKTSSGKGFMIYQVSKVTDLHHLTELVANIEGWKLIKSDEQYKPNGEKQPAQIYIGSASSDRDMKSVDDFVFED